jgi:transcriptional regulator NrdR family protein
MNCPKCNSRAIRTKMTRQDSEASVVRFRSCAPCGHNWYTVEIGIPQHAIRHLSAIGIVERRDGFQNVVFS